MQCIPHTKPQRSNTTTSLRSSYDFGPLVDICSHQTVFCHASLFGQFLATIYGCVCVQQPDKSRQHWNQAAAHTQTHTLQMLPKPNSETSPVSRCIQGNQNPSDWSLDDNILLKISWSCFQSVWLDSPLSRCHTRPLFSPCCPCFSAEQDGWFLLEGKSAAETELTGERSCSGCPCENRRDLPT